MSARVSFQLKLQLRASYRTPSGRSSTRTIRIADLDPRTYLRQLVMNGDVYLNDMLLGHVFQDLDCAITGIDKAAGTVTLDCSATEVDQVIAALSADAEWMQGTGRYPRVLLSPPVAGENEDEGEEGDAKTVDQPIRKQVAKTLGIKPSAVRGVAFACSFVQQPVAPSPVTPVVAITKKIRPRQQL